MYVSNNAPIEVGETVLFVENIMSLRVLDVEPVWEEATVEKIEGDRIFLRPVSPKYADSPAFQVVTRGPENVAAIGYEGN